MSIQDEVPNQGHVLLQDLAGQVPGADKDGLRPILSTEVHHPLDVRSLQGATKITGSLDKKHHCALTLAILLSQIPLSFSQAPTLSKRTVVFSLS